MFSFAEECQVGNYSPIQCYVCRYSLHTRTAVLLCFLLLCFVFCFFFPIPSIIFAYEPLRRSLPFITEVNNWVTWQALLSPSLRLPREDLSIFFPRRLASTRAYTRCLAPYLLVNFCARKSPLAGFELTRSALVVTRLNH